MPHHVNRRKEMGREMYGGEKMLHVPSVDNAVLHRRIWQKPRGKGETERWGRRRFSGESTYMGKDTGRLSTCMRLRSAGNERQTFVKKASDERGGNNSACLDRT
jgi:hypothetical protein